ncbi:hypothetical protein OIU74_025000 [Salix koriyanagi]|nr:hypothetical protein OIU74_025000 [Salix koriyanagi]
MKAEGSSKMVAKEVKASDNDKVVAKEVKATDNDEVITKKLNALESYFGTDGNKSEMKNYFISGLSSLEGLEKKEMIEEYWQWFLCKMDLVGKQNNIIRKHYNLMMSAYKNY